MVLFKYVPQDIAVVDLDKVIDELSTSLLSEVNTLEEAKNGEEFYTLNNGDGPILVPKVYMKYCAPKILVNEAMEGKSIRYRFKQSNDNDQEATTVNHEIATTLVNNFLKQVFVDHYFHADPHPGNILINNGKICFIDFGMIGELSNEFISRLNNVIIGLVIEDIDIVVDFILYVGIQTGTVKREQLYEDVEYLYNKYFTISIKNIKLSIILEEVMDVAKKNNLRLPSEFTMLIRCMIILEGIIAELSPDVNIISLVISYVKDNSKKYLFNNISKEDLFIKGYKASKIPEKLVELTNTLTKGRAKVNLKIDNNKYMDEFNKMINRLSFSLIIAGMIVGSSIIINSNPGPKIHGISIIGVVGYIVSAILGLWLLISIIRSGSLK